MANDVTSAVVKEFASFLKTKCPSIIDLFDNFPAPTQKLKFPSGSIYMGEPKYIPLSPYVILKGAEISTGSDVGKYPVQRVIGMYEIKLQMDLWSDSKFKRHALFTEFFNGFNSNPKVSGVNLQLSTYFNTFAHYSIDSINFIDDESASQRNEWRIKVSILVDVKAIVETNDFLIETIENNVGLTNNSIIPPVESGDILTI